MYEGMHVSVLCNVLCGDYNSAFLQHISNVWAQILIPRFTADISAHFALRINIPYCENKHRSAECHWHAHMRMYQVHHSSTQARPLSAKAQLCRDVHIASSSLNCWSITCWWRSHCLLACSVAAAKHNMMRLCTLLRLWAILKTSVVSMLCNMLSSAVLYRTLALCSGCMQYMPSCVGADSNINVDKTCSYMAHFWLPDAVG